MYQEKLILRSSPQNYIIIDPSKLVQKLGQTFPVPVEVFPDALSFVEKHLCSLGAVDITLRMAKWKDGPIITENGAFILDVRFSDISDTLERDIKSITWVIESGLFQGYECEIISA